MQDVTKGVTQLSSVLDMGYSSADPVSIVADLKEIYHVPVDKIRVLFYELAMQDTAIQQFNGSFSEDAALMCLACKLGMDISEVKYLEIGTNDPVRANNTYAFYSRGARGAIVDPLPVVGELAKMIRPEDKFINAAIADKSGEDVSFYACKSSTVSSLIEEHHEKWNGMSHNSTRKITVPLIGVNELFEMIDFEPDYFLVDAEGYDDVIIRGLDFNKHKPKVVMVEVEHTMEPEGNLYQYMLDMGYVLYTSISSNSIFVLKEYVQLL